MPTAPAADWTDERSRAYWNKNVALQVTLLAIWFVVAYVLGILLAEPLHDVRFFNFPLSYWIAQNGSIFVFVALIFFYAWRMDLLDHEYDVHEEDLSADVRKRFERRMHRKVTGESPLNNTGGEG
jgi:putative solute:sodium symporter small subunit